MLQFLRYPMEMKVIAFQYPPLSKIEIYLRFPRVFYDMYLICLCYANDRILLCPKYCRNLKMIRILYVYDIPMIYPWYVFDMFMLSRNWIIFWCVFDILVIFPYTSLICLWYSEDIYMNIFQLNSWANSFSTNWVNFVHSHICRRLK